MNSDAGGNDNGGAIKEDNEEMESVTKDMIKRWRDTISGICDSVLASEDRC